MLSRAASAERAPHRQPRPRFAGRLDCASGGGDDVLHDGEAEPGPPRAADSVGTEEPLEEARQVLGVHAGSVVRGDELVRCDRDRQRRAGARVPDRVLGEVVDDDPEHAWAQWKLRHRVSFGAEHHRCSIRRLTVSGEDLLDDRQRARRSERDDGAARLELAEEEHLVHDLGDLRHFAPRLLGQLDRILPRQRRGLEQGEDPRKRGAKLVGDRCREAGAQLVVGILVALRLGSSIREPVCGDNAIVVAEHDERLVAFVEELLKPLGEGTSVLFAVSREGQLHTSASMAKVLIVEDDEVIADGMARHLSAAGFEPLRVADGTAGLRRLRFERPDVAVVDLMLPGTDGWNLIESARREGIGTPIVVVSARGTEHDRVHALEIGADDYLVKPFSMKELVARVQANARRGPRAEQVDRGDLIELEELRIDPREVQAFVHGEDAGLTPTEFRLLYALALEGGRVVSRDELLQRVWGRRETHRDRTVDVFVRRLRKKIDAIASRHTFIQTRFGVGYKLEAEPK